MKYNEEIEFILNYIESADFGPTELNQLICLWTAFCIHNDLCVDTGKYDSEINELWNAMNDNISCPYSSFEYERFYNCMSKFLV